MAELEIGDVFTVADSYKRRTFWQWLFRAPKHLHQFTVTDSYTGGSELSISPEVEV